jgi:hypothetical protein
LKASHPNGVPLRLVDRSAERFAVRFEPFKGEKRVLVSREDGPVDAPRTAGGNGVQFRGENRVLVCREDEPVEAPQGGKIGGIGRIGGTSKKPGQLEEIFTNTRQGGEKALSKSESGALLKGIFDGQLSQAATTGDSNGIEPSQLTTDSADTLFRTDASAANASESERPAPITRDKFLERLPKRVIRGGKLIDVRPEIAQLLGAPASARAPERPRPEEGKGKYGLERDRSMAESSSASSGIKGDPSVEHSKDENTDGCDASPPELRSGETETGGKKDTVCLKVRGAEAAIWLVELPKGATVGQLYRAVEKLR